MTPSPSGSLVFRLAGDGMIPCAGPPVSFQVAGEAASLVSAGLIEDAAAAVLHYFRQEMKRSSISVGEFSAALELVLHSLGLDFIKAVPEAALEKAGPAEIDLRGLVGEGLELGFFRRLREELQRQLAPARGVVCFHGLRPSIMRLLGARRWSPRCQQMHERIVDYLRSSLQAEKLSHPCKLLVH
jgi:hypothetical protein